MRDVQLLPTPVLAVPEMSDAELEGVAAGKAPAAARAVSGKDRLLGAGSVFGRAAAGASAPASSGGGCSGGSCSTR